MRLILVLTYLSVGTYGLNVTMRHWSRVRQLPDSVGSRKIERLQMTFLTLGVLFLLAAIWTCGFLPGQRLPDNVESICDQRKQSEFLFERRYFTS